MLLFEAPYSKLLYFKLFYRYKKTGSKIRVCFFIEYSRLFYSLFNIVTNACKH